MMNEQDWQKQGLCRGIEPEVFFPVAEEDAWRAKEICNACPVKEPCLINSLKNRERYGVWGGVSEKERQDMFRRGVAQRLLAGALEHEQVG
ncbi:MAG: WhiB family transcriptional regulator [Actinomycetota bacterium]|jgi:WhiB family transcriptional regulator, redox-sensing transcriptional regulator